MANRVTADEVEEIIYVDTENITDITPFIDAANALVTELCSDSDYTDARLKLIELWLSAHVYTVRDPRNTDEKAGSVGRTVQSKVDLGFDTSHYGQMAMRLDTDGNLALLNERTKKGRAQLTASVQFAGTERYDDTEDV